VDRLIIRILPSDVRTRHGAEIADLLDHSSRPVRDRADVLIAAVGLRLGPTTRPLLVAALLGVALFTAGLAHALRNLRDGAVEILDHWWSAFILVGLMSTLAAATLLVLAHARARVWRQPP
jgi:hypothetical protein